jgi:hypothetical protein
MREVRTDDAGYAAALDLIAASFKPAWSASGAAVRRGLVLSR